MSKILKLRKWAAENDARVLIKLKYPYDVSVGRLIQAVDKEGNIVEWSRAFGTKRPDQVIESIRIESILVRYRSTGEEISFKSFRELEEYCGL